MSGEREGIPFLSASEFHHSSEGIGKVSEGVIAGGVE